MRFAKLFLTLVPTTSAVGESDATCEQARSLRFRFFLIFSCLIAMALPVRSALAVCGKNQTCTPAIWEQTMSGRPCSSLEQCAQRYISERDAANWGEMVGYYDGVRQTPIYLYKEGSLEWRNTLYNCIGMNGTVGECTPNPSRPIHDARYSFSVKVEAHLRDGSISPHLKTDGNIIYAWYRCPPGTQTSLAYVDGAYMCVTEPGPVSYVIEIVPVDESTSVHGSNYLLDLAPSGTLDTTLDSSGALAAKVYDSNGNLVQNVGVEISLSVVPGSGGHDHDTGDPARPLGRLGGVKLTAGSPTPITGSTGPEGFIFSYEAPNVSGDYRLSAKCTDRSCEKQGPSVIWVGVPGLVATPPSVVWHLYGDDSHHTKNHHLTVPALSALAALAALYKGEFPNAPVLHLNDAGLERGGLFDCKTATRLAWWTTPHNEHRLGIVIDVQANGTSTAIPERNIKTFKKLITKVIRGTYVEELSKGHIHVRLLGEKG